MDHLHCVVQRVTYANEQNGYTVLKCSAKGYQDLVTVVDTMPETHVGSVLTLEGFWKVDAKYGRQFSVQKFEETLPATVYGIEKDRCIRLRSGILYTLNKLSESGHCYAVRSAMHCASVRPFPIMKRNQTSRRHMMPPSFPKNLRIAARPVTW